SIGRRSSPALANGARFFLQACPWFSPWLSDEGRTVLGDELLERRRLASADLLDHVVRAGKDTVLVIDGDFMQMLDEEGTPCRALGLLFELAVKGPGGMLGGRLLAARGQDLMKHRLEAHLLVLDVLAQHAAQDLRDFLVGELGRPVQRVDL